MTTDRVLIPLGAIGVLDLPRDIFDRHLVVSQPIAASSPPVEAPGLVNAKTLAGELSLPVSCIYEHARTKRIPSVRIGKHVRFDRDAVRNALQRPTGTGPDRRSQVTEQPRAATSPLPRHRDPKPLRETPAHAL